MPTKNKFYLYLIYIALLLSPVAWAKPQHETILQKDGVIWSFAFISASELLLSIRDGRLYYVNLDNNTEKQLPVPAIAAEGQGGLLDVHFHKIEGQGYVYVTYSTYAGKQLTTALARGKWSNNTVENFTPIFVATVKEDGGRHFGSRLLFHESNIYMTIGDRGERDFAQDLSYHNGKLLKLDLNGQPAKDNPFLKTSHALPEIWSYGHRNPQGIDIDLRTNTIYSAEFGPRGGDELNHIKSGANYGWPVITYGKEYWGPSIGETHHPDMEQPIAYWVPSISPSGMAFYNGNKLPKWQNNIFLANLSAEHLRRLVISNNKVVKQEVLFADLNERIRHVRSAPDGYLYFSTDSGKIIKVLSP